MTQIVNLENENIRLSVDISYGGKPISLINKKHNTEWVWFDEEKKFNFNPEQYSDYDSQWIGGYEELFPNDKVEVFNNRQAPDHGELWASYWKILKKSQTSLTIVTKGYFTNAYVYKEFDLNSNKLTVHYSFDEINLDTFLFKLHLALPINQSKIDFKFESYQKVDEQFGNIASNNNLNNFISSINKNEGTNDFIYFYGVDGKISVKDRKDNELILKYDNKTLPYFWIFQSRGGWNGLNVNVLEPCNAGLKDIDEAVKKNLIYLPKKNKFETWYTIELS
tara:strand:- start:1097 stop:1933 length:837 start_codon:yes stop_codon:yes gene_type:complete